MPGDYSQDAVDAYDTVKADGGPIVILNLGAEPGEPLDPALPWEGSAEPAEDAEGFPHFAAFGPLSGLLGKGAAGFSEAAYIPAYGLTHPIVQGTIFRRADGTIVTVVNVIPVQPAGDVIILFMCEVSPWPGA